jgi:hypothetical protein
MKIEITTSILNGLFKRNRNTVIQAIKSFEGKEVVITFEKPKKKRSNQQNRYYWSTLIPITQNAILDTWGEVWSIEKTHCYLKENFCFNEKVNESTGQIIKVPKSTTENTTTEMEVYHTEIREHLKEWFNVDAPLPNEDLTLNFN